MKEKQISKDIASAENIIRHAYNQGYEQGYDEGYKNGIADGNINDGTFAEKVQETYNNGLNDAWECIRRIIGLGEPEDIVESAGLRNFICKYSASEAIKQLNELGYALGEKIEPCDDCISRQAVKELFQEACEMKMYDFLGIDDLPSVKPQEPILDKIRAEIEQLTIVEGGDDYVRKMAELFSLKMKVLQIIDKYKAETEDT